jgi:hypothetical protein
MNNNKVFSIIKIMYKTHKKLFSISDDFYMFLEDNAICQSYSPKFYFKEGMPRFCKKRTYESLLPNRYVYLKGIRIPYYSLLDSELEQNWLKHISPSLFGYNDLQYSFSFDSNYHLMRQYKMESCNFEEICFLMDNDFIKFTENNFARHINISNIYDVVKNTSEYYKQYNRLPITNSIVLNRKFPDPKEIKFDDKFFVGSYELSQKSYNIIKEQEEYIEKNKKKRKKGSKYIEKDIESFFDENEDRNIKGRVTDKLFW